MAADIDSQHLLLKGKDHVLGILSHVRKFYLVFLFLILGYNVKKAELPGHVVLLIVGDLIHNLHIGAHELLSRPRKAVKGSGLDKVFDSLLVYLLVRHPRDEILEIGKLPSCVALAHHGVDDRLSDALNGGKSVTDGSVIHGKTALPLIDIRREDADPHAAAGHDILRHLAGKIDHGGHKGRHKLHRIIIFQISGLVGHHRIAGRMGLVKGILGKIHHIVIDLGSHLLRNPLRHTARDALFRVSVDEVCPLFFHHRLLLFAHGPAHQIAASQGISSQIPDNLHHLLLIHDTAVGGGQNGLKLGAGIDNGACAALSPDVFGNKVHRTRTIKRNSGNDILQIFRL